MRRWLVRLGKASGILVVVATVAAIAIYVRSEYLLTRHHPLPGVEVAIPHDAASIVEGRRLALVRGCLDGCHGKDGQGALFFDEPAIARLYAPNLSAAARRYTDVQLATIIRHGLRPDGTSVLIMPADIFAGMTDDDTARIVAWLRSMPPLEGPGPGVELGPIGRLGLATGRFRFAADVNVTDAAPAPARTPTGARGRYLASTICAECHGARLQGGSNPEFTSPDLRVVAAYSPEQFARLMRTGLPVGERTLGIMRVRAQRNLSHLTDEEIAALYEYLHSLAGS